MFKADINSVIDELVTGLQEDRIADAISSFASSEPGNDSFMNASARLGRSVSHIMDTAQDAILTSENVSELFGKNADLVVSSSELTHLISDMFFKVLLLDYTGPTDPLYIAERNNVISTIESFRRKTDSLASDAASVFNETKDSITIPAVVVDNILLSSDKTGVSTITMSPEDFTIRAHVKNISTVDVSGLSAMLTVTSIEDSISVSTPLEMTVGSGALEADDGDDGAGNDEADVVWQFKYNGDPSKEASILLSVDILENGDTPVTFSGFGDVQTIEPDITLTDKDLDGMPDDWERSNGLDDTKDDSEDDKDNDGLTNLREFELDTDPQNPDTDSDGLSDGEETTGGDDGFVTDPLNTDTDDDGVEDGFDGLPVDGSTSEKPNPEDIIGEPEVSVDKTEVAITKEERIATVSVTNSGEGTLPWTAVSGNEAIAVVSPDAHDLRNGDGIILFSAPAGYDFDTPGKNITTVRVIDVVGTTKDFKEITVKVGEGEERVPPEDDDGGDDGDIACPVRNLLDDEPIMKGEPLRTEEGKSSLSLKTMEIKTLRDFRDNVLSKTQKGITLIKLYYKYSSEVTGIINADPELKPRASSALKELVKGIMHGSISATSILDIEKNTMPSGLEDEINGLIDDIAEQGSDELKNAIEEARALLRNNF